MSNETPVQSSPTVIRIIFVFIATVLLLTYCSWHVYHPPLREDTFKLSPEMRKRLTYDLEEANAKNPGEKVNLHDLTQTGKYTIIEFYSLFSPDCLDMEPKLEKLARAREDMAIRRLNIDRDERERRKIDYESPLARQFQIHSVPEFKLFDQDEKLIAEGEQARHEVELALLKATSTAK
jgi:thiol-disulfide isomerase/thioredoxin